MKMDKKKWIILGCGIAVICVIILILVFTRKKEQKELSSLFADSDYPLEYYEEDGNLIFLLHVRRSGGNSSQGNSSQETSSKGISWEASVADASFAEVSADGEEEDGRMTYIVQPKNAGKTELSFIRKTEVAGFVYEAVRLAVSVHIVAKGDGLSASCGNSHTIEDAGGDIGGASTDMPYVLMNEKDGTGKILFVGGLSDWELAGDTDLVSYEDMGVDADGNIFFRVKAANAVSEENSEDSAEAGTTAETTKEPEPSENASEKGKEETVILTMSSEENQIKEKIDVTVDAGGKVSLKLLGGEEGK